MSSYRTKPCQLLSMWLFHRNEKSSFQSVSFRVEILSSWLSYRTETFFSWLSPTVRKSFFPWLSPTAQKFFLPGCLVLHGNLFSWLSPIAGNTLFSWLSPSARKPFQQGCLLLPCRKTLCIWLCLSTQLKSRSSSMTISSSTQRIPSLHRVSGMALIDLLRLRLEQYYWET